MAASGYGGWDDVIDLLDRSAVELGQSSVPGLLWTFRDGSMAMTYEITGSVVVARGYFHEISSMSWEPGHSSR